MVKKATDSWPKTLSVIKMLFLLVHLFGGDFVLGAKRPGQDLCSKFFAYIYVEYGFSKENYCECCENQERAGAEEIKAMMENFRSNPPREIGGSKVVLVKDFKTLKATDGNGNITEIDMPEASNVLQYFTEDGTKNFSSPVRNRT